MLDTDSPRRGSYIVRTYGGESVKAQFPIAASTLDSTGRLTTLYCTVRAEGDWEAWLEFFLTGVGTQSNKVRPAFGASSLYSTSRKIEAAPPHRCSASSNICSATRSIPGAAARIGISAPTVAKSVEYMQQLGLLREATGRQRHRLSAYDAYLSILNEGTEPIR